MLWYIMTKLHTLCLALCCAVSLAVANPGHAAQPAPDIPAYGWWHARTPVAAGHPTELTTSEQERPNRGNTANRPEAGARPVSDRPDRQMGMGMSMPPRSSADGSAPQRPSGRPGGMGMRPQSGENTSPPQMASGRPAGQMGSAQQGNANAAGMQSAPLSMRDRRMVKHFYLSVSKGAEMPAEAPEVYYRFTTRTLERHGGVPINSKIYKANVVRDKTGWRTDIYSPNFGTAELFSRFTVDGKRIYSQHNYLHFVATSRNRDAGTTTNAPPAAPMPPETSLPEDWPQVVFPTSNYNAMPLRTIRIGDEVSFTVEPGTGRSAPVTAASFEDNLATPLVLPYKQKGQLFTFTPRQDEILENAPRRVAKNGVLVVTFPDTDEAATFCLGISRSKWSGLDLNSGLFLLFGSAILAIAIVLYRRRRFKYYDRN